jgi:CheY-like chemotaxis protein
VILLILSTAVKPSPTRASILILEDDEEYRRFLMDGLSNAGYSVVDSGDANEVLTILDGGVPFDLLITDIMMPRLQPHGIAVGNMAAVKRRGIKIIYITGNPAKVPSNLIDTSVTPLLGKPIRMEVLLETVTTVLSVRSR